MIGKMIKSKNVVDCIKYVVEKEGADLVGGNIDGTSSASISAALNAVLSQRSAIEKPICHIPISLVPGEYLSDDSWRELGKRFLSSMGFTNTPYLIVRHTDTAFTDENGETFPRDHVHIVVSRVRQDGSVVKDSWDYNRSQKILKNLEEEYNLHSAPRSRESRKLISNSRDRDAEEIEVITEKPVKYQLQDLIDEIVQQTNTVKEFTAYLAEAGVETRLGRDKNGEINGISFKYKNIALAGSHLGGSYSFPRIKERLDKVIEPENALENGEPLLLGAGVKSELKPQSISEELVEKHRIRRYFKERIDEALLTALTLENLVELLEKSQITTVVTRRRDGTPHGISFGFQGTNSYGSDVGKNYSASKLTARLSRETQASSIEPEPVKPPVINEEGTHLRLRDSIRTAAAGSPTMADFVDRLALVGVDVCIKTDRKGRVRGLNYVIGSEGFRGTELGREFSFTGLQKYLGVTYASDRSADFDIIRTRLCDGARDELGAELVSVSSVAAAAADSDEGLKSPERVGVPASRFTSGSEDADSRQGGISTDRRLQPIALPLDRDDDRRDDISDSRFDNDELIGYNNDEIDASGDISGRTETGQAIPVDSQFGSDNAVIPDSAAVNESNGFSNLVREPDQAINLRQPDPLAATAVTLSASNDRADASTATATDGNDSSENADLGVSSDPGNSADSTVLFTSARERSEQLRIGRSDSSSERLSNVQRETRTDIASGSNRSEFGMDRSDSKLDGDAGAEGNTREFPTSTVPDNNSDGAAFPDSDDRASRSQQRRQLKAALKEMYLQLVERVKLAGENLSEEQTDRGVAMLVMQDASLNIACLANSPRALQLREKNEVAAIDYLETIIKQAKQILEASVVADYREDSPQALTPLNYFETERE